VADHVVRMVPIASVLDDLLLGDLVTASERVGVMLSEYFIEPHAIRLWRLRADQIAADPEAAHWVAKAFVSEAGVTVGFGGFHGPPDESGMVEIGYRIDPAFRRQGYARAAVRHFIELAAADATVRVLRVSISPDNAASLATVAGLGFEPNGDQWDDEDGLELIFDRPV
jgi:ribosomal-protein-alanine N-acetyltransferase